MTDLPTYRNHQVQNTQGTDAPGQTSIWVNHYSNATRKYAFPAPSNTGLNPNYPLHSRMLKVRGASSVDEWWFLISFIAPTDALWGAGGQGGFIRNWHNTTGDIGNGGSFNGVQDVAPKSDPVSALVIEYHDNHRIRTALAAPYSGGSTMQLESVAGLRTGFGLVHLGAPGRQDNVTFTGISGTTLTGCTRVVPKGNGASGAIYTGGTWPIGTTVDGPEGGIALLLNNYISNGGRWLLPDPVPGQRYDIVLHVIFGRNDNADPTMPVAMRSARAGSVECWVNGSDTKVVDVANACILQRTNDYYKAPGTVYVQQYVDFWDGGPYLFAVPFVSSGGVASNKTGPWEIDYAATRLGSGASGLAEAVADMPIPSGTESPGTSGMTDPGVFFNNDGNWGIVGGVAHGTQNHHIVGTSPNPGTGTVNMVYNPATGLYSVSAPAPLTAEAFRMPPSLGGNNPPTLPANVTLPVITGTPIQGQTLSCSTGGWSGTPTSYSYQWEFSYDNVRWFPLTGETAATLALLAAHVGVEVRCKVTASNVVGAVVAASGATVAVSDAAGEWLIDGTFEVGAAGWSAVVGTETVARSTVSPITGTGSLKVDTPGGVPFQGVQTSRGIFCPAGQGKQLAGSIKATAAATILIEVETYDATDKLIRTTPKTITATGSTQTIPTLTVPEPSQDSYHRVVVTTGPSAQAITFRLDDLHLTNFTATPAQPTVVAVTTYTNPAGALSSATFPITVVSPTNYLDVTVSYDSPSRPVTAITANGVALTKVSPSGATTCEVWRLKSPALGTYNVVITSSSTVAYVAAAVQVGGADVSGTTETTVAASGTGLHPTVTISSAQNELVLGAVGYGANNTEALAPDSGQTDLWNARKFISPPGFGIHGAGASKPGDASVSIGWTVTGTSGQPWDAVAISVKGAPAGSAPTNTTPAAITGTATQGQVLTVTDGVWTNTPTSISFEWQRDVAGNGVYSPIPAATARRYTIVVADAGCHIRCRVTAANAAGSLTSIATAVGPVAGSAPALVAQPVAFGPITIGSTLATDDGVWNNTPTSFTYQWQKDDGAGGAFSNIGGATAATHVILFAEDNCRFRCNVTAINAAGSTTAASTTVGPVSPAGVTDTFNRANVNPLASPWAGPFQVGTNTLQIDSNLVKTTVDSASQAYRTDISDSNLVCEIQVPVLPNTAGKGVGVAARIQNPGNGATARAYYWDYILGSGFRFFVMTAGGSFAALGSYDTTHTLLAGEAIRIEVVGTTLTGYYRDTSGVLHQVTQLTDTTISGVGTVGLEINDSDSRLDNFIGSEFNVAVPANTAVPTLTAPGGYAIAATVSASTGSWSGSPSSYAYQWQRNSVDIPGATNSSYTISVADAAATLRVKVIATNRAGDSTAANSAQSVAVTPLTPANDTLPAISGSAIIGQQLVVDTGIWTGAPLPTFTYQWRRSLDSGGTWSDIASATGSVYLISGTDLNSLISCRVTATNGATATADAAPIGPVAQIPVPPVPPTVFSTSFRDDLFHELQPLEEALPQ